MRRLFAAVWLVAAACTGVVEAATELTLEERIDALEALERVRHRHTIGAIRPFERTTTRADLERRVRDYQVKSILLEEYWGTPITRAMLAAETRRMVRESRMPERLREAFAALGDEPRLIHECLARPLLVDRLIRNFFASDGRIHGGARTRIERVLRQLETARVVDEPHQTVTVFERAEGDRVAVQSIEPDRNTGVVVARVSPTELERLRDRLATPRVEEQRRRFLVRTIESSRHDRLRVRNFIVPKRGLDSWLMERRDSIDITAFGEADGIGSELPGSSGSTCEPDDTWDNPYPGPSPRGYQRAIWTGSEMLVWGGRDDVGELNDGGRYDPATDTWASMSSVDAPAPRLRHTAIWTGSQMIVWGGTAASVVLDTGGRYDPATDSWTSTSSVGVPEARHGHTAVWTGSEMIVWGGSRQTGVDPVGSGARYDPLTDSWASTSAASAPIARYNHTAVWTGSEMVVWGGFTTSGHTNTGGRYDPVGDTWTATSVGFLVPDARQYHTAVWTGERMIVWGGAGSSGYIELGGQYTPATDSWLTTGFGGPASRISHTAVWTGTDMIVWGGLLQATGETNTGSRLDTSQGEWFALSETNAPAPRSLHSAVWTGDRMIVWGGFGPTFAMSTGGRYSLATDQWTPSSHEPVPEPRVAPASAWTGSEVIVWGGTDLVDRVGTGGRYDPASASWTETTTVSAPEARSSHTAVWTGSRFVVWGGRGNISDYDTGGRYDPVHDVWYPTTLAGAPGARDLHTAVWTGEEMIVWGGSGPGTGGRYDPLLDRWATISDVGAPTDRSEHSAVWTGAEMIVWGSSGETDTGGRYDPATDSWMLTSTVDAPQGRHAHTALWTGSEMIIWGGRRHSARLNDGGRYDPDCDCWTAMTTVGAPSGRTGHKGVWTGSRMIVWGGLDATPGGAFVQSGGRYDPVADSWQPTTLENAPLPRGHHAAEWTGSLMLVWGGNGGDAPLNGTGRYILGSATDDDGDGFSECDNDCNDALAVAFPGATEVCDGRDNDCNELTDDGAGPPPATASLRILDDRETLVWGTPLGTAASDVVRGTISQLAGAGGFSSILMFCVISDEADGFGVDPATPAPGQSFFYLHRFVGCGQNGSYEVPGGAATGDRDAEINVAPGACL